VVTPLRKFRHLNQVICERLAGRLPHTRLNIYELYEDVVAHHLEQSGASVVADIGGGHSCPYAKRRPEGSAVKLVAVDLSLEAMSRNSDVDEKRVADVTKHLPFDDEEVDLLTSRSVLEHLDNIDAFIAESARVLRRGGYSIHLFTGKFAWFALLNRMLNRRIARKLLFWLHPESRNRGGHPAVYDRCYSSAIRRVVERHGLEVVHLNLSYGTNYCYFFVPLFLLVSLYEIALQTLRLRNLAATLVVVARRA
jgi:ubiquinone/menaquinone biosynthesis C-methylase UbiE